MHNALRRCARWPRRAALRALVCVGMVLGPAKAMAQKVQRAATRRTPAHHQQTHTTHTTHTTHASTRTSARSTPRPDAPEPKPLVEPLTAVSDSALAIRDSIVALARSRIGTRYVWGGEEPDSGGVDCSGLVRWVMSHFNLKLPRTAAQQAHTGERVATQLDRLRPGDLLTFGRGRRITHIGIYVGDGKMVHASTAAHQVVEVPVMRGPSPLIKPWRGARRLVVTADSAKGEKTG